MYIACPKCGWRPRPRDQWTCTCGHTWHIFETNGVCPMCLKQWTQTYCFLPYACGKWSELSEWYHEEDSRTVEQFLADEWDTRSASRRQRRGPTPPQDGTPPDENSV